MMSKSVALGLLATACVTAAAGGAYLAVRQNQTAQSATVQSSLSGPTPSAVAETEAVVSPPAAEAVTPASAQKLERPSGHIDGQALGIKPGIKKDSPDATARKTSSDAPRVAARPVHSTTDPAAAVERPSPARDPTVTPAAPVLAPVPQPEPMSPEAPPVAIRPKFVEVVVPASSVVGLHVETSITSETARVEDRVEARVTRDVMADGHVAIPAGTRAIGDVILVERGGKMKDKARLGVRFHTLVLADGNQVPFRTDAIFREGSSPGAESARKIGGAAVGGAILGAIIGGAKGAAIGGATGAAGGSAVVMAGDRNAATLPAGTVVTVRLSSPVAFDVQREQ